MKKIVVIGAGFSGLASAALLAQAGNDVTILEKNALPGGRARKFSSDGFTFDMGPSWYWMPDVFDRFFQLFGKKTSDFYTLERLDPSYKFYFGKNDSVSLPASRIGVKEVFEHIESGAGNMFEKFLDEAEYKYKVAMSKFVYKPGLSMLEFVKPELLKSVFKLDMFRSFESHLLSYFKNPRVRQMLEFPVLFLGGTAKNTPALYSLMNYGDIELGTWYPKGGMYKVVEGMLSLAISKGVKIVYNSDVTGFEFVKNKISKVLVNNSEEYSADYVLSAADYRYVDQLLLPENKRSYSESYWDSRVMSPSSLIFFLGIDKKLDGFEHHTLFFDEDLARHSESIYKNPEWPEAPSLYFSCTSKTDTSVAPEGNENLFVLIPVAAGIKDTPEIREKYFEIILNRIENITGASIRDHIVYKRSYAHIDFEQDYHAFKGNAYGLANTLLQTAFLKPKMRSKKVKNLYYAGQLTAPGPGVPPALISGEMAANLIMQDIKSS